MHPLRGSLVRCLSDVNIELVAADKRGLWWLDRRLALTLLPLGASPVHVATLESRPRYGIAIDADAIYVPTYREIEITPLNPMAPSQNAIRDQSHITAIAVDDTYVFWTAGGNEEVRGSVNRWPKRGGPVEAVADGQVFPRGLVVDEKNLYWRTSSVRRVENPDLSGRFMHRVGVKSRVEVPSRLMTMPKAGGAVKILGEARSKWSTEVPEAALIDDPTDEVAHIAVDSTHVYWTTRSSLLENATIWRTSKADGTTTALVIVEGVDSLTLTNTSVYVDTPDGLLRIPKTGGEPVKSQANECFAHVVSTDGVYCAISYLTMAGDVLGRIELIREE